jgi:hypothetical protein
MFDLLVQAAEINSAVIHELQVECDKIPWWNVWSFVRNMHEQGERLSIQDGIIAAMKICEGETKEQMNQLRIVSGG